jgi:hypothetical protein
MTLRAYKTDGERKVVFLHGKKITAKTNLHFYTG